MIVSRYCGIVEVGSLENAFGVHVCSSCQSPVLRLRNLAQLDNNEWAGVLMYDGAICSKATN